MKPPYGGAGEVGDMVELELEQMLEVGMGMESVGIVMVRIKGIAGMEKEVTDKGLEVNSWKWS